MHTYPMRLPPFLRKHTLLSESPSLFVGTYYLNTPKRWRENNNFVIIRNKNNYNDNNNNTDNIVIMIMMMMMMIIMEILSHK